jgi:predicted dehydrogenase
MSEQLSRRAVLRGAAVAGVGLGTACSAPPSEAAAPAMIGLPFEKLDNPRFGIIGLGSRGGVMLPLLLAVPGAKVTALCDVQPESAARAVKVVTDAGQPKPAVYTRGEEDFENLCARDDVDFVYIATPWDWHVPMALAALRAGKHVGVECPMALTVKDLWELVDTSERTRRHCIQLENCCYGRNELLVLRMAHAGRFGRLLHGSGAYRHDQRAQLFSPTFYVDQWRRRISTRYNGDLYPTHGLGPVAAYLDIHRGDRFVRMTSMSTPAIGLAEYRATQVPPDNPAWQERYVNGDVTVSLIQTELGRVVQLEHGVSNPHPYSRRNHLAGTRGVFEDFPARIHFEADHDGEKWARLDDYAEHDHWLWTDVGPRPSRPGDHGGMDYLMLWRLVQCLRLGLPPDIDVYDSAAWSAPFALSVQSVAKGGAPVEFPDFTRGRWRTSHPGTDSAKP